MVMLENSTLSFHNASFAYLILRGESEKDKKRLGELFVYLGIFCLSLLINASIFYVVLYGKKISRRSVSLLIAHLSVVTIAWSLHGVLYAADKYEIIILRAPYLCGILSFARNTHHAVFPLNVCGVVYERLRSFREECDGYYLIVHRVIVLIWIISAAFSWPSYFSYEFEPDAAGVGFGTCKKVIPFGWHVAYEVVRFIFLHVLVCSCLAFALYSVKSKLERYHSRIPIQNGSRRRTHHRIRYLCYYSNLFIFDWIPIGFLISFSKLLFRESVTESESEHSMSELILIRIFQIASFLHYIYGFLNPLIYVRLNENIGVSYVLGFHAMRSLRDYLVRGTRNLGSVEKEDVPLGEFPNGNIEQGHCDKVKSELDSSVAEAEQLLSPEEKVDEISSVTANQPNCLEEVECCETFV